MADYSIDNLPIVTTLEDHVPLYPSRDVGADAWTETDGGFGSGDEKLASPTSNNNSKVSARKWDWIVPVWAVQASTVVTARGEAASDADRTLRFRMQRTGNPHSALSVDCEVYNLSAQDGAGSNLVTSGTVNLKALSTGWLDVDFDVDMADVSRGDCLAIVLRVSNDDTGGAGGGEAEVRRVSWPSAPMRT